MNSAQRRKSNREHPHVITLDCKNDERYFEHDERVEKGRKWCKKNCKGSWRTLDYWDKAEFKFAVHKDAVLFALKWL